MYITLILGDGKETKSQKIEMQRNTIPCRDILKSFGVEKLGLKEKIWIKRLNFDEYRKDAYTLDSALEWDKFNSCEIAISLKRPEKPQTPSATNKTPKPKNDSSPSINSSKRKALEEMLIMSIVLENQNTSNKKPG